MLLMNLSWFFYLFTKVSRLYYMFRISKIMLSLDFYKIPAKKSLKKDNVSICKNLKDKVKPNQHKVHYFQICL